MGTALAMMELPAQDHALAPQVIYRTIALYPLTHVPMKSAMAMALACLQRIILHLTAHAPTVTLEQRAKLLPMRATMSTVVLAHAF